eukprot:gnl/Chilomastix_cuspidata/142.p2 GENE.gnl/Chilomastix_cuspidata/142~~gnl/Chilomastix_cuspidata/142.p2  ORF type:complete len:476 (+),score=243.61 gnl/Chilomastix_cuspidata/142:1373-2800(+)
MARARSTCSAARACAARRRVCAARFRFEPSRVQFFSFGMSDACCDNGAQRLEGKRNATPTYVKLLYSSGLLLCGAFTTISMDTSFAMYSYAQRDGVTGKPVYATFEYEWFTNALMFLGMAFCLIGWANERRAMRSKLVLSRPASDASSADRNRLLADSESDAAAAAPATCWQKAKPYLFFVFPTIFDLVASGVGSLSMGSFYVPASVYQMLNGSVMIFTPLVSMCFLKRRATYYEWWGIIINIVGLCGVGISATLNQSASADETETGTTTDLLIGMACCLVSQLIYAFQFVFEEITMADFDASPNMVVGIEGGYGFILMVLIVCPVFGAIGYEDDVEALQMIGNNLFLLIPLVVFIVIIAAYNFCGQNVTQLLNCTTRTILEALRALTVWIFSMLEYYISYGLASRSKETNPDWKLNVFGDSWEKYSWVQLIGFVLLAIGSLIFNGNIKLPEIFAFRKPKPAEKPLDDFSTTSAE